MPVEVSSPDVAVIGGGVIGAACARALAARGLTVTIFDPGPDPAAASAASAGLLAAQIEHTDEVLLPLAVRSRDLYEDLAAALKDTTGTDIGFRRLGIATVAFTEARADELRDLVGAQRQAGLRCDWLEPAEVHERWPGTAPTCHGALFAPEDGAVDPKLLTAALLEDAKLRGATLVRDAVRQINVRASRVAGVVAERGTHPATRVVVAAGAWAPRIAGMPRPLPVEPVRGQLIATAWPAALPPVILFHGEGYLLPRGNEAVLGSTMEHVGFDGRTTPEGLAHIRRVAAELCPAFARLPDRRSWAGLRPVTPDGRPIVGPDPETAGLWYATGHGRNGVLLAALTGEIIAELISSGHTETEIAPLSIARFTTPPAAA
jgi:glycine oxidase